MPAAGAFPSGPLFARVSRDERLKLTPKGGCRSDHALPLVRSAQQTETELGKDAKEENQ